MRELEASTVDRTEREALVKARRGQGVFRQNVALVERSCRIKRVTDPTYLIASHIEPWRHATNEERLDGENGLFLAPQADFLFDRGFISFADGRLLVSPVADEPSLVKLGWIPITRPKSGASPSGRNDFSSFIAPTSFGPRAGAEPEHGPAPASRRVTMAAR